MWMHVVWVVAGLALIIQGGNLFVAAAVRIAEFLRMPRVVVGTTLVSLATTTPELVVSVMSGARGESGLAVGNAVGSCLCNIGLILGVTAVLKTVEVHRKAVAVPLLAMVGLGGLMIAFGVGGMISRWEGWVLIAAVGTSLPELITAITSARQSVSDLAVGNVIGANIANLTFIVGTAAVFGGVRIDVVSQWLNFPALMGIFGLLVWMLWRDPRLTRREGVWLMIVYGVYLAAVTGVTLGRGA